MAKQQVIRVGTSKDKAVQSKAQKEFNRLTKKIEKTEKEIKDLETGAEKIQQRVEKELRPQIQKLNELQARLVRVYDRVHENPAFKKTDKKKLAYLIRELAGDLIDQGMDELKLVYDKYNEQSYDEEAEESEQGRLERMKQMAEQMLGVDLGDVDLNDPEKMDAFLREKIQEQQEAEQQRQREAEERWAKRPKSEKQQAKEARREEEARSITKSVRTLYMDLVKAFHPDREPDEAEKARKTEIMQRVTQAYEASDLLALLRLQLEFNRIDQNHLETLADEQLMYYNKILNQRAQELEGQLFQLQTRLGQMSGSLFGFVHSAMSLEFSLNTDLNRIRQTIKAVKSDLGLFTDPDMLKLWLKEYQIPRRQQSSFYDF